MAGSTISITYDGSTDITANVMFAPTTFEMMAAAQPGSAELHIKDEDQTLSFITGRSIEMVLDGIPMWTGYIMSIGRQFAFPALDTTEPAAVKGRIWILRCIDLNVLFDKRVIRNTSNYLAKIPDFDGTRYDGDLITNDLTANYLDLADDNLDLDTEVDDVVKPVDPALVGGPGTVGQYGTPGTKWREIMQLFSEVSGAVWYIAPTRRLHYKALENSVPSWGFSDVPDGVTTIGFRELDLQEDISQMANDALIWGGDGWAGGDTILFSRRQNATSISEHGRWQLAEVHFGEQWYKMQAEVDSRGEVIVDGSPGAVPGEPARGLSFPQFNASLAWFAHDVPSGEHLQAGQIVTITLYIHGSPLILDLPLRTLRISFPNLDPSGNPYVRFQGNFSLQLTDPKNLWTFILKRQAAEGSSAFVATANGSSSSAPYGAFYSDAPIPLPDGGNTVFTLNPSGFAYIAGTTQVYVNGLLQIPLGGLDYIESDPAQGEITFTSPPAPTDEIWIICRLANSYLATPQGNITANAVMA